MATIQDMLDWLNQGAQGDIPGTGGSAPGSPSQTAQPQSGATPVGDVVPFGQNDQMQYQRPQPSFPPNAPYPWDMYSGQRGGPPVDYSWPPARPMLPANEAAATQPVKKPDDYQPGGQTAAPTNPGDYAGNIPPTLLPQYQALVRGGLPPAVAYSIMMEPSTGEGEKPSFAPWPYPYQGEHANMLSHFLDFPPEDPLAQHMWGARETQQQNLPTWEGHTPGEDDSLGFNRLPSGQYVPALPYQQPPSSGSGWDEHNQTLDDTSVDRMLSNPEFLQMLLDWR